MGVVLSPGQETRLSSVTTARVATTKSSSSTPTPEASNQEETTRSPWTSVKMEETDTSSSLKPKTCGINTSTKKETTLSTKEDSSLMLKKERTRTEPTFMSGRRPVNCTNNGRSNMSERHHMKM